MPVRAYMGTTAPAAEFVTVDASEGTIPTVLLRRVSFLDEGMLSALSSPVQLAGHDHGASDGDEVHGLASFRGTGLAVSGQPAWRVRARGAVWAQRGRR